MESRYGPLSLPPRRRGISRNYSLLFLLKLPVDHGGVGVDEKFEDRYGAGSIFPDRNKNMLVRSASLDLLSLVDIGMSSISEKSPLKKRLAQVNQEVITWLDEWVAPDDSLHTNRNMPMYRQTLRKVLKTAERMQPGESKNTFLREWWENLNLLRFLMVKGSTGSIMLNGQNGVDTTTICADLIAQIDRGTNNEKLLARIIKLFQGSDLDLAVFPSEIYHEVFEEFHSRQVLKRALGEGVVQRTDLVGDEKEKYEVADINEDDVRIPPGFRLHTKKLFCSFSAGNVPQNKAIPYRDIRYHTKIINEHTGQVLDYTISALEFMPSVIDKSILTEDTRTGLGASLLSQHRGSGVFLVNVRKRYSPTNLELRDIKILNKTGSVAKLNETFASALALQDFPVGSHLSKMINGTTPYNHSFVATLLGRSLRDGLFNILNITKNDARDTDPFSYEYYQTFTKLSEGFKPEMANTTNIEEMMLGLTQGWLFDFPFLMHFLNKTGFARHLVMGQNAQMLQAMTNIAEKVRKTSSYKGFLTRLRKAKEQSIEGRPKKIEGQNLTEMAQQNFSSAINFIREDDRIPPALKEGKTDFELLSELINMSFYNKLPPEAFWGANLTINVLDSENLKKILKDESVRIQKPVFGYMVYGDGSDAYIDFHFTRYPRVKKYNIGSPQEYEKVARNVASTLHTGPPKIEQLSDKPRFRIVLGLNRGYSSEAYPYREVRNVLGEKFVCKRGKIISVNYLNSKPYEEPALVIEGDMQDIQEIFQAADLYGQERFTVEELSSGQAYIVETRHCTASDLAPPSSL